jgi:hypothetical protein
MERSVTILAVLLLFFSKNPDKITKEGSCLTLLFADV